MEVEKYLERLEKKDGYYELVFDDISEFIEFIRPEKIILRHLMTKLSFEKSEKPKINLEILGQTESFELQEPMVLDKVIFRGQALSTWGLSPSLYRNLPHICKQLYGNLILEEYRKLIKFQDICDLTGIVIPSDSSERRESQKRILKDFSANRLDRIDEPYSFWHKDFREVGAFAQHIGVKTSFLDWSHHILVACYFACTSAMAISIQNDKSEDFLNGKYLSLWILNKEKVPPSQVMIIEPPKSINNHISHQHGLLSNINIASYFKNSNSSKYPELNDILCMNNTDHLLLKINLPLCYAAHLFEYVNTYNFNACNLFRGINGVATHHEDIQNQNEFTRRYDVDITCL